MTETKEEIKKYNKTLPEINDKGSERCCEMEYYTRSELGCGGFSEEISNEMEIFYFIYYLNKYNNYDGDYRVYYPDKRNLAIVGYYNDGKKHGAFLHFNKKGNVLKKEFWVWGEKVK